MCSYGRRCNIEIKPPTIRCRTLSCSEATLPNNSVVRQFSAKMFASTRGVGRLVEACVLDEITHIRLMRKSRQVIGYARDALVIFAIVAAGMYVLDHPEKVDAFLDWVLRRN